MINIEDVFELKLPTPNLPSMDQLEWAPYNNPKSNNRKICSITSLDGTVNGVDTYSVREYNINNGTEYNELSFKTPTKYCTPFNNILSLFEVGRSHYLAFEPGGYFPWHRDADPTVLRLVYTINNCDQSSLVWILDDKVLTLQDKKWYLINVVKKHVVFNPSTQKTSTMAIFNIANKPSTLYTLYNNALYK